MEKTPVIPAYEARQPRLLLTKREAARALAVCDKTISNMMKDGRIRAVRIGRAVRFDAADLREFIETQKMIAGHLHNSEVTLG